MVWLFCENMREHQLQTRIARRAQGWLCILWGGFELAHFLRQVPRCFSILYTRHDVAKENCI